MFSWDFTVYDDGNPVAELDLAWIREAGDVVIDDVPCRMYRDGLLGDFVLEARGFTLVRAVKLSVFLRTFEITYDDVIAIAEEALGEDAFGYRTEFVELVRHAATLTVEGP